MAWRGVLVVAAVGSIGLCGGACGGGERGAGASEGREPLPACEWCGSADAPEGELGPAMEIAGGDEPGRRMVLRGRVFEGDGQTPAAGVLVYAYHTDATGVYRMDGDETGNGRRHGALRGWLRTDAAGRYEIRTIMPGAYPDRREAAHVHLTLTYPGREEDWITPTIFAGDERITDEEVRADAREGRFGAIVEMVEDDRGVLHGERDLRPRGSP